MTLGIALDADGKTDRRNAVAAGETRISKTAMRRPRNDKRTEIRHREYQKHPFAPAGYVMPGLADAPDGLFRDTVKEDQP